MSIVPSLPARRFRLESRVTGRDSFEVNPSYLRPVGGQHVVDDVSHERRMLCDDGDEFENKVTQARIPGDLNLRFGRITIDPLSKDTPRDFLRYRYSSSRRSG